MKSIHSYQSLGEALEHALLENPDSIGLIEVNRDTETHRLSYQEIYDQAIHVTKIIEAFGFEPDQHCGILMTNQSKWNISAIGVFFAGGVLVPLDYKLSAQEQIDLILHADLTALIIEFPLWDRMMKSVDIKKLEHLHVFVTEIPQGKDIGFAKPWDQDSSGFSFERNKRSKTDIATIVYSSGTFGRAKGCMLTHENYLMQANALSELFPVDQRHSYFSFIPTNHAIDFMCGFFLPLMVNSKTVHQRTLRPEFIASTIANYQITHIALVPMLLKNLQTKLQDQMTSKPWIIQKILKALMKINQWLTQRNPRYELSRLLLWPIHKRFGGTLEFIFVGGAFTDSDMAQFFYDLGFSISIGYGLTEAGTVLTVNDLKPFRGDTVGKPLSITEIEIRNPNEQGIGEVWAKGPTVMKGYYKDEALTQEVIKEGWLSTGDLGMMDGDHLILKGRKKNMVVTSGGKNIYPEDIEHQFQNIPASEYCVYAGSYLWPDKQNLRDQLILIAHPTANTDQANLLKIIQNENQKLPDYKRISQAIVWDQDFPKTATLKIKREMLAQSIQTSNPKLESL